MIPYQTKTKKLPGTSYSEVKSSTGKPSRRTTGMASR